MSWRYQSREHWGTHRRKREREREPPKAKLGDLIALELALLVTSVLGHQIILSSRRSLAQE